MLYVQFDQYFYMLNVRGWLVHFGVLFIFFTHKAVYKDKEENIEFSNLKKLDYSFIKQYS